MKAKKYNVFCNVIMKIEHYIMFRGYYSPPPSFPLKSTDCLIYQTWKNKHELFSPQEINVNPLREAIEKFFFLVSRPLRGGGVWVRAWPLRKKIVFDALNKNSGYFLWPLSSRGGEIKKITLFILRLP